MTEATALYSYVNMILLSIMGGVFVVFLTLASWWARDVHTKLQTAIATANSMEEWAKAHDKQDDERHAENKQRLDRNHSSVHDLRDQLSTFALRYGVTLTKRGERVV